MRARGCICAGAGVCVRVYVCGNGGEDAGRSGAQPFGRSRSSVFSGFSGKNAGTKKRKNIDNIKVFLRFSIDKNDIM